MSKTQLLQKSTSRYMEALGITPMRLIEAWDQPSIFPDEHARHIVDAVLVFLDGMSAAMEIKRYECRQPGSEALQSYQAQIGRIRATLKTLLV